MINSIKNGIRFQNKILDYVENALYLGVVISFEKIVPYINKLLGEQQTPEERAQN